MGSFFFLKLCCCSITCYVLVNIQDKTDAISKSLLIYSCFTPLSRKIRMFIYWPFCRDATSKERVTKLILALLNILFGRSNYLSDKLTSGLILLIKPINWLNRVNNHHNPIQWSTSQSRLTDWNYGGQTRRIKKMSTDR